MNGLSPARATTLLWDHVSLVVVDTETLTESPGLGADLVREMEDAL